MGQVGNERGPERGGSEKFRTSNGASRKRVREGQNNKHSPAQVVIILQRLKGTQTWWEKRVINKKKRGMGKTFPAWAAKQGRNVIENDAEEETKSGKQAGSAKAERRRGQKGRKKEGGGGGLENLCAHEGCSKGVRTLREKTSIWHQGRKLTPPGFHKRGGMGGGGGPRC